MLSRDELCGGDWTRELTLYVTRRLLDKGAGLLIYQKSTNLHHRCITACDMYAPNDRFKSGLTYFSK